MFSLIDVIIFLLYIILVLAVGIWFKKRGTQDISSYFVGGRSMPWWLAGLSMVATTFAADTPLAVTELIRKNGISGNWLWWNFLIGGMLTTFFFAKLWRRSEVLTELELIKIRYSGKVARYLRGLKAIYIALIMNTLIIAWVNLAMVSIISGFFGISNTEAFLIVIGLMLLAFIYSGLSGLWGVAATDAIQFVLAMAGAIILAVLVVNSHQIGGIEGLKAKLPPETLNFFPSITKHNAAGVLSLSIGAFLAYGLFQWWASWYPGAEPGGGGYIAQRLLSTKNEKHSFLAAMLFQFSHYVLRPFPWILVGLATIVLYPQLSEQSYRMGYVYAMKDFLPNGLRGLVLVSFFAAYMSTISTQLNFGASILTNDFYLLLRKSPISEKSKVNVGKLFTFIIMLLAILITTQIKTISGVWHFIIECGAGLGFVLIARWYWWRINAWAEIIATIVPFIVYGITKALHIDFPASFFITIFITLLATLITVYITRPTSDEVLEKFYYKVHPQGWWGKFSPKQGINKYLLLAWISSVIVLYSLLFAIGKLIFHFYIEFVYWLILAFVFVMILFYALKKIDY